MIFNGRYERAKKWQLEQKAKNDAKYDPGYEITPEDIMEKGDMAAMMISGFLTIFPIAVIVLLIMVFIGMAFMHIL
ncbi:MAG: hypothetical protein IJI46_03935 [Erysipelotrichaceae bacterium]|nr:hypothetical protein [Erysipelotrichaceae bacterium]